MKNLKKRILKKYKKSINNSSILQNLGAIKDNGSCNTKEIQKKYFFQNKNNNNEIKGNININININNPKDQKNENPNITKIELSDGSVYIGDIKDNLFEGKGEYTTKNYKYIGEFSSGKRHGKGYLEDFEKKIKYKGDFRNNMKEGFGEEKYLDGSIYKGEFKEDLKHGKGILLLKENDIFGYDGEFKYDQKSGKGKFKWNENKEYIGEWSEDEICGYGILKENKMIHIGFFLNNVKNGLGATFNLEKKFVLLGNWENDIIYGFAILRNLSKTNNKFYLLNKNINFDLQNEIIIQIIMEKINENLDGENLLKFKNSNEYEEMIKIYNEKFFTDYQKYIKEISL